MKLLITDKEVTIQIEDAEMGRTYNSTYQIKEGHSCVILLDDLFECERRMIVDRVKKHFNSGNYFKTFEIKTT